MPRLELGAAQKGSIALCAALFLFYFLCPAWLYPILCTALIAIHFFPKQRLQIFFLANLCSWFFLPYVWGIVRVTPILELLRHDAVWPLFMLASLFVVLLSSAILLKLRKNYLAVGIIFIGFFSPLLCRMILFHTGSIGAQLLDIYLALTRSFYLYAAFACVAVGVSYRHKLNMLFSAAPFWSSASTIVFVPITAWSEGAAWSEGVSREKLTASQISGLRLLLLSMFAYLLHAFFRAAVFGDTTPELKLPGAQLVQSIPSLQLGLLEHGFARAAELQKTCWERWLSIVTFFLQGYLRIAFNMGFSVAIARLAGFQLPANFNYPWRATSFVNFFGRMLFYYNQVLMQLFYPFVKRLLSPIQNKRVKIGAALFLSVSVGGFLFHLSSDTARPESFVSAEHFWEYSRSFLYFIVVAALVTLSTLNRKKRATTGQWIQPLRVLVYLLAWSLVLTLSASTRHSSSSWTDLATYLYGLIPGVL